MHTSAIARRRDLYEHLPPETVGNTSRVTVSELSGRSTIQLKAEELGLDLDAVALVEVLERLKLLEHRGYHFEVADGSLELLMREAAGWRQPPGEAGTRHLYAVVGSELALAPQSVLRPLAELVDERDGLEARLRSEAPPLCDAALDAARAEQRRARAALDAVGARRGSVEADGRSGALLVTARADERRWREHLDRLASQAGALEEQVAARADWERDRAPDRDRLAALGRAVELRSRFLGRAAAVSEPAYLTAVLGPRPAGGDERRAWLAAATAVATYRDRWGVDDGARALGPEPGRDAPRAQRVERQAAEEAARTAAQALSLTQGRGRERGSVPERPLPERPTLERPAPERGIGSAAR